MSYILNALRKSEQERQAVEPDTVTTRILSPPPQHPKGLVKLIAALVISNVLIVAYFIWYNQKAPAVVKSDTAALVAPKIKPTAASDARAEVRDTLTALQEPASTASATKAPSIADIDIPEKAQQARPPVAKPEITAPALPEVAPAATPDATLEAADTLAARPEPALAPAASVTKTPSIADIVAAKKAPAPKPQTKPVIDNKPAAAPMALPGPEELPETPPATESAGKSAGAILPATNSIPFLYEMPSGFRRDVPRLNINVFVYAKEPMERFVMIDMVKYKTGEMINDGVELKEIRPDSLVVRYRDQTFQLKRP